MCCKKTSFLHPLIFKKMEEAKMKNILFDLDGTLTDPALGITNSVMHALKRFNIPLPPRHELYKFIGPPLAESFSKYYGFSDGQKAVEVYREYFSTKGLFENDLYEGIENFKIKKN